MRLSARHLRLSGHLLIAMMACHGGSSGAVVDDATSLDFRDPAVSAHLAHAEQVRAAVATRK